MLKRIFHHQVSRPNIDWGKVIDGLDGSLLGPGGVFAVGGDATGGG
jgi:hypothetical protein